MSDSLDKAKDIIRSLLQTLTVCTTEESFLAWNRNSKCHAGVTTVEKCTKCGIALEAIRFLEQKASHERCWSLNVMIDTDDDAEITFRGKRYCTYGPQFALSCVGSPDEIRALVKDIVVGDYGKFSDKLKQIVAELADAVAAGGDHTYTLEHNSNQKVVIHLQPVNTN